MLDVVVGIIGWKIVGELIELIVRVQVTAQNADDEQSKTSIRCQRAAIVRFRIANLG